MYWFLKHKEYDPTPYSHLTKMLHKSIGCNVNKMEIGESAAGELVLSCSCGIAYQFPKK